MKGFARPITSVIRSGYSSQAAVNAIPKINPHSQDVKISQLQNGLVVASVENGSPVSRVAVLFNAGPRYESYETQGLTHYLRVLSMQSSKKLTGFGLTRSIQQIGGNLSCTTNREQVIYSVEALRDHIDVAFDNLNAVANLPAFKTWEIGDIQQQLHLDRSLYEQSLDARLMELLHKASYRNTLGNSLYIDRDRIGSYKRDHFEAFRQSYCVSSNAAIVGIGVDHETLLQRAKRFNFFEGKAPETKKAKYHGGELREDVKGPLAYVACVTEGLSLSSPDLLPLSLLLHVIGVGPSVKYSENQVSKLYKAASGVATSPFAVSCVSTNYSDSGLFGINLVCGAKDTGSILKSIFSVMNQAVKGKFTEADLQRAKNHLKSSLHFYNENASDVLEWFGTEVLLSKQYLTQSQIDGAIDKVTLEEVASVAKRVVTGKPSMAAVGNLSHTPYIDELFNY